MGKKELTIYTIEDPIDHHFDDLPPRETEEERRERMRVEGKTTTFMKLSPDLMYDA